MRTNKHDIWLILLLCIIGHFPAWAQRTVTGKVTDAKDGSGLPGVGILLKGTTSGTSSDATGNFSLSVPETDAVLIFSMMGMKAKEIEVGAQTNINISMDEDVKNVKEVVVTAFGIEKETKGLGYSATKINGSELVNSRETNMVNGLAGKVAGVQVISSGGSPGASAKIILRGNKSFTGENQPLFVIDGVPMDNSTTETAGQDNPFNPLLEQVNYSNRGIDINPDDIENITVLKGPAASSLYGVRAGNGAIIITTKRGKKGQKPQITFSTSIDVAQVNKLPKLQKKYAQGYYDADSNQFYFDTYDPGADKLFGTNDDVSYGIPRAWGPTVSSLGLKSTDNAKDFFRNAYTYNTNLSISAGNENSSVRLSIGRMNQNGIVPNTDFSRTSLRLTAQTDLGKKFTLFGTANYVQSGGLRAQNGSNLSGVMLGLLRAPVSFDLSKGYEQAENGAMRTYFVGYDNPYWTVNKNTFKDINNRFLGNFALTYDPLDWLKLTYRVGTDMYSDQRKGHFAVGSNNTPDPTGEITENTLLHQELYADLIATASRKFSEKFFGSLTVGNNMNQITNQNTYARGRNLAIPNFYNLSNTSDRYADESTTRRRSAAFYYDANVSYNNMYYLGVTGRYEYSSTFGPNQRAFFFPSVNGSIVLSEIKALKNFKNLSLLKVRAAVAQSANTPAAYSAFSYYNQPFFTDGFTNGLSFPYNGYNGYGKSNLIGNTGLKPEITTGTEFGADIRFFDDRLKLDVTYYNQVSTNVLLQRPIPYSTGHSAIWDNGGEIVNKGWEILLSGSPVKSKNFEWDISVNYTRNRNEVKRLIAGLKEFELETGFGTPAAYAAIGKPYGALYGTTWERNEKGELIIDDDPSNYGLPKQSVTVSNLGSAYPDWTAGIRNTFTYKNLSLSALLDIRQGGKIWNGTEARLNRYGASEQSQDREKTYIIPGVKADGTANDIAISAFDYFANYKGDGAATEMNIQTGSWVRLRELSLAYLIKKIPFLKPGQTIEITATGRNLWLQTSYTGIDPETSLTGAGSNIGGFDYFNLPNTKSYNMGIKFNF